MYTHKFREEADSQGLLNVAVFCILSFNEFVEQVQRHCCTKYSLIADWIMT